MGFMDELKRLAHPYEDEDEDDFEEFEPAPRAAVPERRDRSERMDRTGSLYSAPVEPERRSNKVVNIHTTTQLQVVLVKPERFENASEIADHLREKRTVVLNLEQTNKDIARRLLADGLPIRWYIIGYGGDEPLIRRRIAEAGMEDAVILLGKRDNPYPYIRACDLYVQPSRYEGKSVTVREAQMLARPVVIARYATSASQLEDGVDGVIVPMDNEGCAAGIAAVLRDEALRQKLTENTKIRDYTNAGEIEKIYRLLENV